MDNHSETPKVACQFGSCFLSQFSEHYGLAHIPLSLSICFLGVIANTLNVVVLTRKHMRSPTNVLLTGLSLAQLCLVSNYVILQMFEVARKNCYRAFWSYSAAHFKYVNVNMNFVFHTVAFAHTVFLTLFRFAAVQWPVHAQVWLRSKHTMRWSVAIYITVAVLCLPLYLLSKVKDFHDMSYVNCSTADSLMSQWDLDWNGNETLLSLILWVFGISFKLIPCLLITIFITGLIRSLRQVDERKKRLQTHQTTEEGSPKTKTRAARSLMLRARTTRMLIVVVLLCVSVELPHGVVNLLMAIYGPAFIQVYEHLGDFFEMLTLLYSSINFVLYCAMSSEFRKTFSRLYFCRQMKRSLTALWRLNSRRSSQKSRKSGQNAKFPSNYGIKRSASGIENRDYVTVFHANGTLNDESLSGSFSPRGSCSGNFEIWSKTAYV